MVRFPAIRPGTAWFIDSTARLLDFGRRPASKQLAPNEVKAMLILIFIVALLGEHCNFDRLRLEHSGKPPFSSLARFVLTPHYRPGPRH